MLDPGDRSIELAPVDRLLEAQQWRDALRALGPLRRQHPKDPEVWQRQAAALRGSGDYSEAKVAALMWLEFDPDSADARGLIAELDGAKERQARQRAEENRWAAEMRRAALPDEVLDHEAERSGQPLEPQSRKDRRRQRKQAKRAAKERRRSPDN